MLHRHEHIPRLKLQHNCNTLQHTAIHCNILPQKCCAIGLSYLKMLKSRDPHTATHCNTLQHTTILLSNAKISRPPTSTYCNILQHAAIHCLTSATRQGYPTYICADTMTHLLQHTAVSTATFCNILQHATTCCGTEAIWGRAIPVEYVQIPWLTYCNILQHTVTYCNIQHVKTPWLTDCVKQLEEKAHAYASFKCVSHVTYRCVMSLMKESCHVWMSRVTYEWVMSRMKEPCTYEGVMSRMNESCHVW